MEARHNPEDDAARGWDAVPRDGPAVLVVDRAAFDRGEMRGGWIRVTPDSEAVQTATIDLIGDSAPDTWVIIDQIGLGPTMVPEDLPLDELAETSAAPDEPA